MFGYSVIEHTWFVCLLHCDACSRRIYLGAEDLRHRHQWRLSEKSARWIFMGFTQQIEYLLGIGGEIKQKIWQKSDLMVALDKVRGSPKLVGFNLLGSQMVVPNFMVIYLTVTEIFQFETKWWTDRPVDWQCIPWTTLHVLATFCRFWDSLSSFGRTTASWAAVVGGPNSCPI